MISTRAQETQKGVNGSREEHSVSIGHLHVA